MFIIKIVFVVCSIFNLTDAAFPALGYKRETECSQRPFIKDAIALESDMDKARYVCQPGYVLVDPETNELSTGELVCVSNNKWSPSVLPICKCIASFGRLRAIDTAVGWKTTNTCSSNQSQSNLTLGCQRYQDNYMLLAGAITGLSLIICILLCAIAIITFRSSATKRFKIKEQVRTRNSHAWL